MLLNTSFVACLAHTVLAGYLGVTLWRGAQTAARRRLARCLLWFALYSAIFAVAIPRPHGSTDVSNVPLLLAIDFSTADLLAYVLWVAAGSRPEATAKLPRSMVVGGLVLLGAIGVEGVAVFFTEGATVFAPYAFMVVLFVLFALIRATCLRARRRGGRGRGALMMACVCTLIPIVYVLALRAIRPDFLHAHVPLYYLMRELLFLAYSFLLFLSYLDHGHEPMSIEDRIAAGVLMAVLCVGTVASRLIEVQIVQQATPPLSSALVDASARWFLLVVAASSVAVIAFVPLLFRRSVFLPIARLTRALARLEQGAHEAVLVDHEDEIGRMTRSFNAMAAGLADGRERLEAQMREVDGLNQELRRQVAARSRQLSEVLARAFGGDGLDTGTLVDGRYRVDGRLGAGGMGVVYAVTRITDERPLALKIMARTTSAEDGIRFAREAEIAAGLAHAHLVGVIDVGVHDGLGYLVMERIDGGSLQDARDRWGDVAWALPLLGHVAKGLAVLHEQGILHRDLKPGNVLLSTTHGALTAKISDFGIARRDAVDVLAATANVDATERAEAMRTATGVVIGTLAYLAPELARGPSQLSPACDVFAFGVMAYELVSGRQPFGVPPVLVDAPPPPPPPLPDTVPPAAAAAIRASVLGDPALRPTSRDLAAALAEC